MSPRNLLMIALVMLVGCSDEPASNANVDPAASANDVQWPLYARDEGETRYSPLDQINQANVGELGLAWVLELGTEKSMEATPIVVDDVMYFPAAWNVIHAIDARTGEVLWRYDPQVDRNFMLRVLDTISRGVAVDEGTVYAATLDGRLIALNAADGSLLWETLTIDLDQPYFITGAPRVVNDKVIIGNGGAENLVRGYFSAYDKRTGEMAWRFYTIPGDPSKPVEHAELEDALKTWTGEWWKTGGGTVWDSMAYDAELNQLYVGVGNGGPWQRHVRSPAGGDNLFLSSILAINPDTGELNWHYQTTPGDNWDYTAVQHIMLVDMEVAGESRKVLLQAPKNGFFYALDRATGELLSADAYATVTWASHVDIETGRPVEMAQGNYAGEPKIVFPGPLGGHNWQGMAYSPQTRWVYLPAHDVPLRYVDDEEWLERPGGFKPGVDLLSGYDGIPEYVGYLLAWDPLERKIVWRNQLAGYWNGGVLATGGGLVFQGGGDGSFVAFDASSGDEVWRVDHTTGFMAPPITYEIDGTQYISIAAGWGGAAPLNGIAKGSIVLDHHNENRILTFKLEGDLAMPVSRKRDKTPVQPPTSTASPEQIARGEYQYNYMCGGCHGTNLESAMVHPDLRFTSPERHALFSQIVLEGMLMNNGMPSFSGALTEEQVEDIHAYVIDTAQEFYAMQSTGDGVD